MEGYKFLDGNLKVGQKLIARPNNRHGKDSIIYNRLVDNGMDLDWKTYTIQQTTLNHLWLEGVTWAVQDISRYRKNTTNSNLIEIKKIINK